MRTCSFFGHRDFQEDLIINQKIKQSILDCIVNKHISQFFLGGYGRFDKFCARCLKELKTLYPHIQITLVLAYLRNNITNDEQKYIADTYTNTIYPPIEKVPKKFAISKRNEWIVSNSDYIIFYVNQHWGGANNMLTYATREKISYINLGTLNINNNTQPKREVR